MENNDLSPTNNANVSEDDLTNVNHINELPISAVFSNKNSNGDQVMSTEEIESFMGSFPPGFRFYPTDNELITHYLERKIDNLPLEPNKIYEMNIYKYNPETIAAHVKPTTAEKVWYVLTPRDRKYQRGTRPNRAAGNGYWKATGADKSIKDDKKIEIGLRKALVYYHGKPPKGQKTDWIMHEYRLPGIPDISQRGPKDWKLDEWVLCKMYNRKDMDKTMFTQRKRSRDDSCDENLSCHQLHDPICEVIDEDSTRNDFTDYSNNNNHATIFHPQVPTGLCTFPQCSYCMPTFCNYQNCVPQFDNAIVVHEGGTSMTNDIFHHQIAPSPMMIEPISSTMATNNSIGHDHDSMKRERYDIPFFSSCIGGGYDEYLGHAQYDPIDEFLVNNNEMDMMISSEYNMNIFVNDGTSNSKGDC